MKYQPIKIGSNSHENENSESNLYGQLSESIKYWTNENCSKRKRKMFDCPPPELEVSEQVVLLLEDLLAKPILSRKVLQKMESTFNFDQTNADVQHR